MSAILTNPSVVGQNTIQPQADNIEGLIIKRHSAAQTAALLEFEDENGNIFTKIGADFTISSPGAGTGSEHFGAGSTAAGSNATAIGPNASAAGSSATAVGFASQAGGSNSVAIGNGAGAFNSGAFALGPSTLARGTSTTAIGNGATCGTTTPTTSPSSTAIGGSAICSSTGGNSTCIGNQANDAGFQQVLCLGVGATATAANQGVIGSSSAPIADIYFGRGVVANAAGGTSLNATGRSGANLAGNNLTLAAGKGTGNAKGGDVIIQTSPAGIAGSGLNSLATIAQFTGDNKIGIFGVSPVAQQANASQATINAVTDANAKAALQSIYNLLAAYGWAPSTP